MIFGTNKLHKATNGMCQFYVNEWVTRYRGANAAPCVSSRVRLQARNFQRKSYVRPWPIKLSVGNPT